MNKHIFKEYLADIIYKTKASFMYGAAESIQEIIDALNKEGYFIFNDYLSHDQCSAIIDEFKKVTSNYDNPDVWRDGIGADKRLFAAENYSPLFSNALGDEYLLQIKKYYMGPNIFNKRDSLMINNIAAVPNNLGSGGGWHRDSPYSKQFKAIIYLSDVSSENGPFQFIEQSHCLNMCLDLYKNKLTKEGQNRFNEQEVGAILEFLGKERLKTFTATRGTCILVNTKGIHRGKPITQGERFAMTYYFDSAETLRN